MSSILVDHVRRLLVAAAALTTAPWAYSQPPDAWSDRNCTACHGSANLQSFGAAQLAGLDESNFVARLLAPGKAAMTKLATDDEDDDGPEDRAAILEYLIAVRDGSVTASLDLGTAKIGSPPSSANDGIVVVTNERSRPVTFAQPVIAGSVGFSVTWQFCLPDGFGIRTVSANSSCTGKVHFQPNLPPEGPRAANLELTLIGTGGDNSSPLRTVLLSGTAQLPLSSNTSRLTLTSQAGLPQTDKIVLTNAGTSAVTLTSLSSFTGAASGEFMIDPGFPTAPNALCVSGAALSGGASCALPVRFTPAFDSQRDAVLTLTYRLADGVTLIDLPITLVGLSTLQGRLGSTTFDVHFASTEINASREQTLQLSNIGTSPLTLTALTGLQGTDFQQTAGTCSEQLVLDVDASCTLTVTFRPSGTGSRSATLTVGSNGLLPSVPISLAGTGAPSVPRLTLTPPAPQVGSLAFGSQTVGGLYPARVARLTSSGTADVNITSINATSTIGATFSVVTPRTCPATLAFGASCDIAVEFAPSAAETDFAGSLIVSSNADTAPHVLPLAGRGVAFDVPVLAWIPAEPDMAFGIVREGSLSEVRSVVLQNEGPGGALISLINAVGTDAASFIISLPTGCGSGEALYQGESCRVDVQFAPRSSGSRTSAIQVISTGSAPAQLTLSGTGMGGPAPSLTLSPSELDFGEALAGSRSQPLELLIESSGAAPLTVKNMTVTGAFVLQSGSCTAMPFTLEAGASCVVAVVFAPTNDGPASGTITVTTDASPSTQVITMSGEAAPRPDLSGGGCSIANGHSPTDPMLWLMAGLAVAVLAWRRREASRSKVRR